MKSNHHIANGFMRCKPVCIVVACFLLCLTSVAFAQPGERSSANDDDTSKHLEAENAATLLSPAKTMNTPLKKSGSRLRKLFAQIKPGMTRSAVEKLLGPPLMTNENKIVYIRASERTMPITESPWGLGAIYVWYDKDKTVSDKRRNHQYVDPLETDVISIYVKIFVPVKSPASDKEPIESWVQKQLKKRGAKHVQAATHWIKLPDPGENMTQIWNASVDGKFSGCAVDAHPVKQLANGEIKVKLTGWAPVSPRIKSATLLPEPGNRRVVVVDDHWAYFAILVGLK